MKNTAGKILWFAAGGLAIWTMGCLVPHGAPSVPEPAAQTEQDLNRLWDLRVDQPLEQIVESDLAIKGQQWMNYRMANIFFVTDAKLYILYQRYASSLEPSERERLNQQQIAWIQERDRQAEEVARECEGGTIYSTVYCGEMTSITEKRIEEITGLLAD